MPVKLLEATASLNLHVEKVVKIPTLHGVHTDALVLLEQTPYGIIKRAIHAPLPIKCVGFALGTWRQR